MIVALGTGAPLRVIVPTSEPKPRNVSSTSATSAMPRVTGIARLRPRVACSARIEPPLGLTPRSVKVP